MRCDPQVVVPDHLSSGFEVEPNLAVIWSRILRHWKRRDDLDERSKSFQSSAAVSTLLRSIEKFAVGDY
jgi:hypothetical protein